MCKYTPTTSAFQVVDYRFFFHPKRVVQSTPPSKILSLRMGIFIDSSIRSRFFFVTLTVFEENHVGVIKGVIDISITMEIESLFISIDYLSSTWNAFKECGKGLFMLWFLSTAQVCHMECVITGANLWTLDEFLISFRSLSFS